MIQSRTENGKLIVSLSGMIDSSNAEPAENKIRDLLAANTCKSLELDCDQLEYCTSAGLRMILRFKQEMDDTVLTNVHTELYSILDMTGFTEIVEIRKAYRTISVEGCEVIGQGADGKVYRINPDTVVKVFRKPDALPKIHRERELARLAFVAGIPTAIPYDVVRIEGGGYGSVFELLNATSCASLIIRGEKSPDEVAEISIRLLKLIHGKEIRSDILPDMKAVALGWTDYVKDSLTADQYDRLCGLIRAVPADMHLLHGDYHVKNVMLQNGEGLLIDMDTLSHGHPIFELACMYYTYMGFRLIDPEGQTAFLGIPSDVCHAFWRRSLALYLDTDDERRLNEAEDKAGVIGLTRLIRREIRRNGLESEEGCRKIELCRASLVQLLSRVDSLVF